MTLKERLQQKLARAKEIRTAAEQAGREFTEAEAAELETLAAECTKLNDQIAQAAVFDSLDIVQSQPEGRKTAAMSPSGKLSAKKDAAFASPGEYFQAVHRAAFGEVDGRLSMSADDGDEGFSVPEEIREVVMKSLEVDAGDLLSKVNMEVTGAGSVKFIKDVTTPWEAAGIKVHWEQGDEKFVPSKFNATTTSTLDLNGLSALLTVDEDLLADVPRLGQRLLELAPMALRWAINEAIRYGDGVGKPVGYMKSDALVVVPKEANQAAGSLKAENIAKMFAHLLPSSIGNAHWEISSELLPQLMLLKDDAGNLLWTPLSGGYQGAPNGLLLGRPVVFNEHPNAPGTQGDIQLIDPSGYFLAVRSSAIDFAESMHVYFDRGEKAFRWRLRLDGKTILSKPIKPAAGKGTLSKSHFVALAARA